MSLFSIKNVSFSSTTQNIVKNITLDIEKGSVTGLLGKSGCGKSTILKLIAAILVPTNGKVFFEGKDIQKFSVAQNKFFRKRCAFVFQDAALWENQSIEQNLSLPLQAQNRNMKPGEIRRRIFEMCKIVGFDRELSLRPVDLSMGEKKIIAFARALINKPDVLFLDECTESLDNENAERIYSILYDFISEGKTIIYVSHRSEFIQKMQSTGKSIMYEIEDGEIIAKTENSNIFPDTSVISEHAVLDKDILGADL